MILCCHSFSQYLLTELTDYPLQIMDELVSVGFMPCPWALQEEHSGQYKWRFSELSLSSDRVTFLQKGVDLGF